MNDIVVVYQYRYTVFYWLWCTLRRFKISRYLSTADILRLTSRSASLFTSSAFGDK